MDGQNGGRLSEIVIVMSATFYNLLNTTRCGKLLKSEMNTYLTELSINSVKMSLTRGQSAWVKSSSETQRSAFSSGCRLSDSADFNNWLTGITDGDGTFYFAKVQNSWTFAFQISQSSYNLQMLHFIKKRLSVGKINSYSKTNMAMYRVRRKQHLVNNIIPIFDKHPLLTSKSYKYFYFRTALLISVRTDISAEEKDRLIKDCKKKSQKMPKDYVSKAWKQVSLTSIKTRKDAEKIMSKSWLVGFTEAEGSFDIIKKGPKRLIHRFEITQRSDLIVMTTIAKFFDLEVKQKGTHLAIGTCDIQAIEIIIAFFFRTMKGIKSEEYRIWARSFNKRKRGFKYLTEIREKMRSMRLIRYSKDENKTK